MDVVFARKAGQAQAVASICARVAAGLLGFCGASSALAVDDNTDTMLVAQANTVGFANRYRPQMEVSTSSLPRFDNGDGGTQSSRIDMLLLPPRRSGVGLSLGITSSSGLTLGGVAPYSPGAPTVDLGLHWRYTMDSNYRFDITAWRRMPPADAISLIQSRDTSPSYGARVEVPLSQETRKGFVADRGFLGFQLESGARIAVKRSGGKPMLYYRSKF